MEFSGEALLFDYREPRYDFSILYCSRAGNEPSTGLWGGDFAQVLLCFDKQLLFCSCGRA